MKYMGSKNRISKYILPIISKELDNYTYYIEPFVGGCNLIDKVDGIRIGGDNNSFLISMWKGLQRNEERPYTITKRPL
jgi:DNA adenine methylase